MRRRYRNTSFLVELLINILVFSISCAVLVALFGKAAQISREARARAFAGNETLRVVELVKAQGPAGVEGATLQQDGSLLCLYDDEWNMTGAQDAAYNLRLEISEEAMGGGTLLRFAAVAQNAAGEELYTMETATYYPETAAQGDDA